MGQMGHLAGMEQQFLLGVVSSQFPTPNPAILANTCFLHCAHHLTLLTALAQGNACPTPGKNRAQLQNQQVLANPSPSTVYPLHEHAAAL